PSLPPSPAGSAWASPSAARSSKPTAEGSGPPRMKGWAPYSDSRYLAARNRAPMTTEKTVYVVDDDEAVRRFLRGLIGSIGLGVKTYASAQEFLDGYEI